MAAINPQMGLFTCVLKCQHRVLPHQKSSPTSRAAAMDHDNIRDAKIQQDIVLRMLEKAGANGLTRHEIADQYEDITGKHIEVGTVCARVGTLIKADRAVNSDMKRKGHAGKPIGVVVLRELTKGASDE